MRHAFTIGRADAGRRVDRFVQSALKGTPYSLVQRLLRQGKVRVNGARARGHQRLSPGDEVVIRHVKMAPSHPTPVASYRGPDIAVVHRCEEYVVVVKPAGVSCSTGPVPARSLPAWAAHALVPAESTGSVRPFLCHRLDAGTTGLVAFALTAAATTRFHAALATGEVEKTYLVAVWGLTPSRFDVDLPLRRRPHGGRRQPKVVAGEPPEARPALTRFRRLDAAATASLLEAEPVSGRTHQIRAHLLASGWPVVGDPRYGDPERDRGAGLELDHQLLHAGRLAFPTARGRVELVTPFFADSIAALNRLGLTPSLES